MFIQVIKIFLILFFVSDCNNFLHKFMDFLKHYTALLVKVILCEADYRILDLTFRTGFYHLDDCQTGLQLIQVIQMRKLSFWMCEPLTLNLIQRKRNEESLRVLSEMGLNKSIQWQLYFNLCQPHRYRGVILWLFFLVSSPGNLQSLWRTGLACNCGRLCSRRRDSGMGSLPYLTPFLV